MNAEADARRSVRFTNVNSHEEIINVAARDAVDARARAEGHDSDAQRDAPAISDALAVLQRPDVAEAMRVMQRYFDTVGKQQSNPEQASATNAQERQAAPPARAPSGNKAIIKPAVTNNLAVITIFWSLGGCFLLFGAFKAKVSTIGGGIAVFALYGIVQGCLIVFILLVTGASVACLGGVGL